MNFSSIALPAIALVAWLGTAWQGKMLIEGPPQPIVVHSLEWRDGKVTQDRTVTSMSNVFEARWRAEVRNAASGRVVPGCSGTDWFPYPVGRAAPSMPPSEWLGSDSCEIPIGAPHYLWVQFSAGEWVSVPARSPVFTLGDDG